MAKKELTISEFREIIKEEALKLKKRMVLENEKKALMNELKTINESYAEGVAEEGIDEGLFDMFKKKPELSPEEAIKAGEEVVKKDAGKFAMYKHIAKKKPEALQKFLMFVGNNPNIKYPSWEAKAMAPDGTQGFFVDKTVYSYGDTAVGDVSSAE